MFVLIYFDNSLMWGPLFMDYKEVFLGAGSILRGSGAFIYFLIPEKWIAMPTYIPPEAYVLKSIGDYAWIMVGNASMLLIPLEENADKVKEKNFFELNVKVDDRRHHGNIDEWIEKERKKIEKKESKKLKEIGKIKICNHEGAYIVWLEYKKKFGVFGATICEAFFSCNFYCEETGREIFLKIHTKDPNILLSKRNELLSMISSIGCHSRAAKKTVKNKILFLNEI